MAGNEGWLASLSRMFSSGVTLPEQWQGHKLGDLPLLAIDLELTSLDPKQAHITSIGWVEGQGSQIQLASSFYSVVHTSEDLAQSPVIHGLTASDVELGRSISEIIELLEPYRESHVWVFHNAQLDCSVLSQVLIQLGKSWPAIVSLDTLQLAVYQLNKAHQVLPPNSATLTVCRQRLDLPLAPAHNALDDAMATLQLWFAQLHQLDSSNSMVLDDIVRTQAVRVQNLGKSINSD